MFRVVVVMCMGLMMFLFNCFLHFVQLAFVLFFVYLSFSAVLLLLFVVHMLMLVVLVMIIREVRITVVHTLWLEVLLCIGVCVVLLLIRCISSFVFVILLLHYSGLFLMEGPYIPQHILRLRVTKLNLTIILSLLLFTYLLLSKALIKAIIPFQYLRHDVQPFNDNRRCLSVIIFLYRLYLPFSFSLHLQNFLQLPLSLLNIVLAFPIINLHLCCLRIVIILIFRHGVFKDLACDIFAIGQEIILRYFRLVRLLRGMFDDIDQLVPIILPLLSFGLLQFFLPPILPLTLIQLLMEVLLQPLQFLQLLLHLLKLHILLLFLKHAQNIPIFASFALLMRMELSYG